MGVHLHGGDALVGVGAVVVGAMAQIHTRGVAADDVLAVG